MNDAVLLVGAGPMAVAYYNVLVALGVDVQVAGRGEASARAFETVTGARPGTGPLKQQIDQFDSVPTNAIVAVPVSDLCALTEYLLVRGVRRILVEKPGAIDADQAEFLAERDVNNAVRVAYNRRFLNSTLRARELITQDGGVISFVFEFGEIGDEFADSNHPDAVIRNWIFANASHAIDLAFYLAGTAGSIPLSALFCAEVAGDLPRHSDAAVFVGSGRLPNGALFSYHANWLSAAGWRVEISTAYRRLIMQPLETLRMQERGAFRQLPIDVNDAIDQDYKPGLYRLVECFLRSPDDPSLLAMRDQAKRMRFIEQMLRPKRPTVQASERMSSYREGSGE